MMSTVGLSLVLISLSRYVLLMVQEVKADWQTPASAILTLLAVPFPDVCIDEMLRYVFPNMYSSRSAYI